MRERWISDEERINKKAPLRGAGGAGGAGGAEGAGGENNFFFSLLSPQSSLGGILVLLRGSKK